MRILSFIVLLSSWLCASAQLRVEFAGNGGGVDLAKADLIVEQSENKTVKRVAELFADDIEMVTGRKPATWQCRKGKLSSAQKKGKPTMAVIIGTVAGSPIVKQLALKGKIDVAQLENGWERYTIQVVERPLPNVERALVVAGSDRRGVAYGLFSISEQMGVSPWYWWADVPVARHDAVCVSGSMVSVEPSVRYRGFFINDEDWGLRTWAGKNYEKDLGDIGPRTYARVCELLLRLKGNMMAPAMHSCTGAFYTHEESKLVADTFGIMITTSHCEPLLFNNASTQEWDKAVDGEWDYTQNGERIREKLDARVAEAAPYENIYTLAMRGLHDEGMRGNLTAEQKVQNLYNAITDQRSILSKHLKTNLADVPQIFVPYKEALDIYDLGLQLPDEVTIVWPDDNYGYIKRLGDSAEQQRSGGAGVYYHLSYLGTPHDYLWLCTTPPVLMYEELKKAYDHNARRYWLLNVGDIKPMELGVQMFFDMAWDFGKASYDYAYIAQADFLASLYGAEHKADFQRILDEYYRLAWSRKPEYMGWEIEWDAQQYADIADTDFSFDNYNDAQQRLADYAAIADRATSIYASLPEALRPSFYEMVAYPVCASAQMNRKFLMAQLNHKLAKEGLKAEAQWAAEQSIDAYNRINEMSKLYESQQNGKWVEMMNLPEGYCAKYHLMPEVETYEDVTPKPYSIAVDPAKNTLTGCAVIDLARYEATERIDHKVNLIRGIGYDWQALQIGEAQQSSANPPATLGTEVSYAFSAPEASVVTVTVYTLPFFPVSKGREARYGISIDGQPMQTASHKPIEWSFEWKQDVLRNSAVNTFRFTLDASQPNHTLTIHSIDPGQIVQRIVIDWGGLQPSYISPSPR